MTKAWKRRVANGELMKGSGGAALRHHPRLGRRGKEQLKLNRLGNIGGKPNPKRKRLKSIKTTTTTNTNQSMISNNQLIIQENTKMNEMQMVGNLHDEATDAFPHLNDKTTDCNMILENQVVEHV